MEIYNSRYFRINKTILSYIGLWPYASRGKKIFLRTYFAIVIVIMAMPHIIGLRMHLKVDFDRALEHIGVLLYIVIVLAKIFTSVFAEHKLKVLYNVIIKNWETIDDEDEKKTLMQYSERGRMLTVGYITYMVSALVSYITLPAIPVILNVIKPLNESRPYIFVLNGEFIINRNEHYGLIYIVDLITCCISASIIMAIDTMYAACIEHCLGLFAIVKFTETLESSYSSSFLFIMGINLTYFSILSVLVLGSLDKPLNFIRYFMLLMGLMIHLFYLSWPGQKLINHSSGLFQDAYSNEWYESSIKSKKLLNFLILRCQEPCRLTAGGLYVMNFQNFLVIMKTSISYITVFSSFR